MILDKSTAAIPWEYKVNILGIKSIIRFIIIIECINIYSSTLIRTVLY